MTKNDVFDKELKKYGGRYKLQKNIHDDLLESLILDSKKTIDEFIRKNRNCPEVYIDYIDSDGVNACAFKVNNDYYIGVMVGTIIKIKDLVEQLIDYIIDLNLHTMKHLNKQEYRKVFLTIIVRFIVLHEYGHIVCGHVDWRESKRENSFFFEKYSEVSATLNIDSQTRELNADRFAVKACIDNIFEFDGYETGINDIVKIDVTEALVCLYCATYMMFLIFSSSQYDVSDFEKLSHPHPGVRQCYTINTTMNEYVFDVHEFDMDLNTYVNVVQGDYEKVIFRIAQIRNERLTPMSVAYTKEGWSHMLKIHNNWENVRGYLKQYSYIDLEPFERMDYYISS